MHSMVWTDVWTDEWMDVWMDAWMDRWMDKLVVVVCRVNIGKNNSVLIEWMKWYVMEGLVC
jgi:hypothetical protein